METFLDMGEHPELENMIFPVKRGHEAAKSEGTTTTITPLLPYDKAVKLKGWPAAPKPFKTSLLSILANSILDIILLTGSVAFLAFALIVNWYDQAPTKDHPRATKMLLGATQYGPTIFPILFASTIGRTTHAILCWRLAKGERIGVLDMLATSTSLTSTITSQAQLRMVTFFGIALLALWALSPIGGQASIRQTTIGPKISTEATSFTYMVQNGAIDVFLATSTIRLFAVVDSLFLTALLAPEARKHSPLDTWGNIKIPRIESYEDTATPDSGGWYKSNLTDLSAYSSLVGIPMAGTRGAGFIDYQFRIHTPYLHLHCSVDRIPRWGGIGSYPEPPAGSDSVIGPSGYMWWIPPTQSSTAISMPTPFTFSYCPVYSMGSNYSLPCKATSTYVETEISCPTSLTCAATKIRRSRLNHFPANWTQLNIHPSSWDMFLRSFMGSVKGEGLEPTLLDRYMADPQLGLSKSMIAYMKESMSAVDLSGRLSQLMNSYWTLMNGMSAISGGLSDDTAFLWDTNMTFIPPSLVRKNHGLFYADRHDDSIRKARAWPATGKRSTKTDIIIAQKGWVSVLAMISILLIIASLIPLCMRVFFSTTPDIMMNISSLATRNNPHIPLPTTGTYLDASDRARLLKDVTVRFGDVEPQNSIGRLVIASMEGTGEQGLGRVWKRRLYQ